MATFKLYATGKRKKNYHLIHERFFSYDVESYSEPLAVSVHKRKPFVKPSNYRFIGYYHRSYYTIIHRFRSVFVDIIYNHQTIILK